ncbi:Retrotransposon gag protein [Arachis hypogaea]|nr:Retrotransposon gag protein [Arachis hypogaea]
MARQDQEVARKDQAITSKNQGASIGNLEMHMEQIAKQITEMGEKQANTFPNATEEHPRNKGKATKSEEDREIKNAKSSKRDKNILETQLQEKKEKVKPYVPTLPYPQRFKKENEDKQYSKFLDIFKTLSINIPFLEALEQMPLYAKFMKEVLTKKRPLKEGQIVEMTMECSAILQRGLPEKKDDPGRFYIPCTIGNITIEKLFCDLGASINLMPLSLRRKLQIFELKPTQIALQMADKSIQQALGVVENVLIKVGKSLLPADFVILDMEEDPNTPIILGRPFLATGRALIDVKKGELLLRVHDEHLAFHILKILYEPTQEEECKKDKARDHSSNKTIKESTPRFLNSCLKEVEMVQQTKEIKEELDPKPPDENLKTLDKEPPRHELSPEKEEKKKRPKWWRNKKIPTEGFSPGDKVMLNTQPMKVSPQLSEYYIVNRILSLEHLEIIKEETGRKFTVRGEKLRHYAFQPP